MIPGGVVYGCDPIVLMLIHGRFCKFNMFHTYSPYIGSLAKTEFCPFSWPGTSGLELYRHYDICIDLVPG